MAIRKYLIKNNHVEAVYKIVNDADIADSVTIDLDVDLLKSNEDLVAGKVPLVGISSLEWSVEDQAGEIFIKRNGVTIQRLHSSTNITNVFGADYENGTHDIVIEMSGGTLFMRLLKKEGYISKFKPEEHGGEAH